MKISYFCLNRPVFATVLNILIILAGIVAYRTLTVREFPDVATPVVNIETIYPGASAEIVESEITRLMEDTISGIEGVDYIASSSKDEKSGITVFFKPNRNLDEATNDIRDSVGKIKSLLPADVKEPSIAKVATGSDVIVWLAMTSNMHTLMEISEYAEHYVKNQLEILPGVATMVLIGERQPAMRIWIDPIQLSSYALTVQDISNALRHQNIAIPSGRLESDTKEFTVFTKTDLQTEEEFRNIVLHNSQGHLLRLGDVAKVNLAPKNERFIARYHGKETLALGIVKQSTANPLDIAQALRNILPALCANLPEGMTLDIAYDSTIVIKESIHAVYKTILEAIILVILIIFLFLRSLRATLIPILTIPIALIGGFMLMSLWGLSINVLTLLAMVLAIGLVVDDAIVVLENIYRHIEEGMKPLQAARKGIKEVGPAVIAMTLTLVSVFAPIAFASGKIGALFTEFAVVLAGTVVISGFTALTLSPVMCAKFLKSQPQHNRFYQWIERGLYQLTQGYRALLKHCIALRYWILATLIGILCLNGLLFFHLKSELSPSEDRGFIISMGMAPEGSTIDYTTHYALKIEPLLDKIPEINSYFLIVGWPNVQQTVAFSLLKPWQERTVSQQDIVKNLNPLLYHIPGLMSFAMNPPSSLEQDILAGQIGLVIQYPGSYADLKQITDNIVSKARDYPGLQNLDTSLKMNKPQVELMVMRDKAALSGIDVNTIGESLQTLFGGQEVTKFTRQSRKYDVIVQADPSFRRNVNDLSMISVRAKDGSMLPLSSFVQEKETTVASALHHFNKLPSVTLTASLTPGYSLGEALTALENIAYEVGKEKIQIDYSGTSRAFKQTGGTLAFTFALALIVVFLVLAAQFESFVSPFVIMFSVPLGILGALATINMVGGTLNIFSQIGLITLIGLITKHGILIVQFANQLLAQGKSLQESTLAAASLRLRPILMTTAATVLGALPLALSTGAGAESRQAIGWAIVGGMTIGTMLTLIVVPIIYYLVNTLRIKPILIEEPQAVQWQET